MKPHYHKHSQRWRVQFPPKYSTNGGRQAVYFAAEKDAKAEVDRRVGEREEHGKHSVRAEELQWILYCRNILGDLSKLPKVLHHWRETGEDVMAHTVSEAVELFLAKRNGKVGARTMSDVKWRLRTFADYFKGKYLHQLHAGDIDNWLNKYDGWSQRSMLKRIRPLFGWAVNQRIVAINPIESLPKYDTPKASRKVYTPAQFINLLEWSRTNDEQMLSFLILSGLCFLRTSELVRLYGHEEVLRWEDIQWKRDRIIVREGVAKSTRRADDTRVIPIPKPMRKIAHVADLEKKHSGRVIGRLHYDHSEVWRKMHEECGFKPIANGLRKSAISYRLAADPDLGVIQCAKWAGNSEATIKKHYLNTLMKEDGVAWFALPRLTWGWKPNIR